MMVLIDNTHVTICAMDCGFWPVLLAIVAKFPVFHAVTLSFHEDSKVEILWNFVSIIKL